MGAVRGGLLRAGIMNRIVSAKRLGEKLVALGVLDARTVTAEIVVGVDGALFIRSERLVHDDELPKIAEAFAALALDLRS
jgi:hypothetical protein